MRKIELVIYNHQVDSPFYLWPDICYIDLQAKKKSMVIYDTQFPYLDQVSINNTKLTLRSSTCACVSRCFIPDVFVCMVCGHGNNINMPHTTPNMPLNMPFFLMI